MKIVLLLLKLTEKLKRYKSSGIDQIPAQWIHIGGYVLRTTNILILFRISIATAVEGIYYSAYLYNR
jgi:hypothetical protein